MQCEYILRVINKFVCLSIWQFDIDDILRVAEQRNVEELKNSAADQLLSQFKVAFCLSANVFHWQLYSHVTLLCDSVVLLCWVV